MKKLIRLALARSGYQIQSTKYIPRQLLNPDLLRVIDLDDIVCRRMFQSGQALTFIQIGAFDGVSTDPLYKYIGRYAWRGVMLEPQPRPASKLRELYAGNEAIVILEAALDRERGKRMLYTVESDAAPVWAGGMASFQREHIVKHAYLIPGLEGMIRELTVDCITFDDVFDQLPSGQVDLLQIDAEGADAQILMLFPFERAKPAIIHWEIKNLTRVRQEECLEMLSGFGYRFARSGGEDMMAVLG